ncbi:MAG: glycosyltransferase family 1 protein [Chloroflexota bacterium]
MRIGINAHLLAFTSNYRQAGLSRYIYELVQQLPVVDPQNHYTAFVGNGDIPAGFLAATPSNLSYSRSRLPTVKAPVRIAWEQTILPLATARERIDLLFCPVNVRPVVSTAPVIITIHDVIFLHYPAAFHPLKRLYLKAMTGWSARHSAHVITVSEATRRDVISMLGVPPHRVTTVHNGVGSQFCPIPIEEQEVFKRQKGIDGRTILYVGTLEPRKNVSTLIEAFAAIAADPELNDVKLIIGGSKGWYYDEIFATAERLGLTASGRVQFLGRVPDEELPLWYNIATLCAYPSLYEGFGLPPLEAMACGTPAIVSDRSALPEVVGAAGLLVDPEDTKGWSEALSRVLKNESLAAELGRKALEQAARFSWERTARETAAVFRKVMSARHRRRRRKSRP